MTSVLGENIQREWDEEPLAGELWDALQLRGQDRDAGNAMLTELATRGSVLAMMYLGHGYISGGGDQAQLALGEEWLIRSAKAGSIEGRFQLAGHYQRQNDREKELIELKALAEQGYSPAMYSLGLRLYRSETRERSVPEAVTYLKMARDAGHLPAMGLLSWIYRKEKYGLGGRIAAHWYCLAKIPAAAWYIMRYPNSDRLRGGRTPLATASAR
jgi:TPR repeat protein